MHPYRKHKLRKTPKKLACHQCGKVFEVRSFRKEANCPRCRKKHYVVSGKPTPYRKIFYWAPDGSVSFASGKPLVLKLTEIPKDLYPSFKNDPQEFGFEIGLRAIPLTFNPYTDGRSAILYSQGIRLGIIERK